VKKFEILINKGQKIVGMFYEGNKTLMIICNGYDATKDFPSVKSLAEDLHKKKFSVVRFDFTGTGESTGPSSILIQQQVENINVIVNHFKKYKKIVLVGGSLGAIPSSITAILNPKISALVTLNGFFGKPTLAKKERRVYYQYRLLTILHPKFRRDYKYFKENLVPKKINIPTLIIYSKTDEVVDPSQSQDFFSRLNKKIRKLVILPLKKHNLTGIGDTKEIATAIAKQFHDSRGRLSDRQKNGPNMNKNRKKQSFENLNV